MKTKGYLIVSKSGSLRVVKTPQRSIAHDEIAIALDIQIPDGLFKPTLEARISVPDELSYKQIIETNGFTKLEESLSQEIGFEVKLTKIESAAA